MATHKGEIRYGVGFDVNRADLELIKKEFSNLAKSFEDKAAFSGMTNELRESIAFAKELEGVLDKAWNSKLGQLNLSKVNAEITKTYGSVDELRKRAEATGGTQAFNKFASSILNTNTQLKQSNKLLNDMALTFKNTIRFGIASSVFNTMTGSIQKAFDYTKNLDSALNDIRIVTTKSADQMERFAVQANKVAQNLGASTKDYTEAALIFYQQGLNDEQTAARASTTIKAANVTGQSGQDVSEQLTAIWNGFKVSAEETELYIDKVAKVAATTAADLEEMATAMSKVASAANTAGVDIDKLNGMLSTVISVTRESPETIGTAFRSIFARMGDLKLGKTDEDGASLGKVSGQLQGLGIEILDQQGNMREMGNIIEDVAKKWEGWTRAQQQAAAIAMAGQRQYSRLIALFDNWGMYTNAVNDSMNAVGELQREQDIYMDSTSAHLKQLKTEAEETYETLIDQDAIKGMADSFRGLLGILNEFLAGLGGGMNDFVFFGTTIANIFKNQIGAEINRVIQNFNANKINKDADALKQKLAQNILRQRKVEGETPDQAQVAMEAEIATRILNIKDRITEEEYEQLTNLQKELGINRSRIQQLETYGNLLKKVGLSEKTSTETIESRLELKKKELKAQQDLYRYLELAGKENKNKTENERKEDEQLGNKFNLEDSSEVKALMGMGRQQKGLLKYIQVNPLDDEKQRLGILREQNKLIEKQKQDIENLSSALKSRKAIESGELEQRKEKEKAGIDYIDDETKQKAREEAIAGVVSGLTSLVATLTAISGLVNIINDETLSGGEKIKRFLITLAGSLPMIITSLTTITKIMPHLAVLMELEGASAEMAWNKATVAVLTHTTALGPVWAILLAVTAAVAALSAAVYIGVKAYNEDADAAKRAAEATKALKDTNEEVTQSYKDLQATFEAYNTAKDKLDTLTEGTKEWREALLETNEAALTLINSLNNLSGDEIKALYSRSENGEIKINEKEIDKVLKKKEAEVSASNLAVAGGILRSRELSNQADILRQTRENRGTDNMGARMGLGLGIASLTGPMASFTTVLEHFVLKTREAGAKLDQAKIVEHIDELKDLTFNEFKQELDNLGVDISNLDNKELADWQKSIENMANQADVAAEKLSLMAQVQVDNILGNEYDSTTKKMVSNQLASTQEKLNKDLLAEYTGKELSKISGAENETYQNIVRELNNAGFAYGAVQGQSAVKGTDDDRTFTFVDEEGNRVEKAAEWVAQTVAASKAMAELSGNAELASKALGSLDKNVSEDIGEGIKNFITEGNFENLTEKEFNQLQSGIQEAGGIEQYLSSALGVDSEKLAKMLGSDYKEKTEKALEDYSTAFERFTDGFSKSVKDGINNLGNLKDLSVEQQKNIAQTLEDARQATPQDDSLFNYLLEFYRGFSEEDLGNISNVLKDIEDWGNISVDELAEKIKEAGIQTEFTDDQLQHFIDTMKQIAASSSDWDIMSKKYGEIHKIIDSLKYGDTISAEDYAQLGNEAKSYFTRMLDGTYKLTESAIDFQRMIEKSQIQDFSDSLQNQREQISKLNEANYGEQTFDNILTKPSQSPSVTQQQLNVIDAYNPDNEKLADWSDAFKNNSLKAEDYEEIAEAVQACNDQYKNFDETIKNANDNLIQNELAILSSAKSLDELKQLAADADISQDRAAYQQAELDLHEAEKWEDVDTKQVKDYAKHLREVADESEDLADSLKDNTEDSEDLAREIIRMDKGVEDLAKNWDDWSDVLKNSSKDSEEYYEALSQTKDALADLLDTSSDYISSDFITDHMDDIKEAATGSGEAIDRLHAELAKQIIVDIAVNNGLDEAKQADLLNTVNTLQSQLPDLEVGASLDTSQLDADYAGFEETLGKLVQDANLTADQVNAFLGQMGYEADFETEPGEVTQNVPVMVSETTLVSAFPPKFTTETYQNGTKPITQTVQVPRITASANGEPALKVSNLRKKAGGSSNNYSPRNAGGGSPGGSKGGGGGGGGSAKEAKKVEQIEDIADRYHEVNTQIQKVDNSLKKLQSQTDKYVGAAYLTNLNNQWELLNVQVKNYNEKLRIARDEQAELRGTLAAAGVAFNPDGTIANYMQAFQSQLDNVNGLINQYNSLSAEAQEQWDANKTIDNAKEQFNQFKENLDRYDELVSDFIPGLEQEIQDALDKQIEINIKKFNYEIDVRLNMAEAERDWNEWKAKTLDRINKEDIIGNLGAKIVDFSSYYRADNNGSIQAQTRHLNDLLAELNKMDRGLNNIYGNNKAQALEDLKKYYEQLMEDLEGVVDLQDEIHEGYIDMMEEAQDEFDKQLDTYELITDTVSHDMDLIKMLMGDESYTQLAKYYKAQQDNYDKQLDFQRQQVQFWRAQVDSLEEGSKEWEEAVDQWKDSLKDWQSAVEDALENIRDKFENAIDEIFQKLNNKITGGLGLDYVSEQWDLIDKQSKSYLDTINKLQGINDIESKYLKSINDTTNKNAQKKLKEAMDEELENLRAQDKLTEADLERAEKRYQLLLAQITLEEAQQNKSQLRLRRDSQGNYTYQYAANDDAIREAEDEIGKLYSDLYNFDKEHYVSTLEEIYDLYDEYQEKMAEAAKINDPELRAQKELMVQEYYGNLINNLVARNQIEKLNLYESAFQDLAYLYKVDLDSFTKLTQSEKDLIMYDLIPQWDSGVQHMIDVFAGEGGFKEVTINALNEVAEVTAEYDEDLHQLADTAGATFDDLCYGIDRTINETNSLIRQNNELIKNYEDQLNEVAKIIREIDNLVNKYNQAKNAAEQAAQAAYKYWQEQQRQAASAAAAASAGSAGGGGRRWLCWRRRRPEDGGSGRGNGNPEPGEVVTYLGGGYYSTSYGGTYGNRGPGGQVTITQVREDGRPYPIHVQSSNSAYGWLRRDQLSGYDTGGYTGEWMGGDSNGRLALLHQKELVLNAKDTENLLDTVSIMRNLAYSLGANMLEKLASFSSGYTPALATENGSLEQNVHIDAQFPNVRNASEIEDALNNLVNAAAQRAMESKRGS